MPNSCAKKCPWKVHSYVYVSCLTERRLWVKLWCFVIRGHKTTTQKLWSMVNLTNLKKTLFYEPYNFPVYKVPRCSTHPQSFCRQRVSPVYSFLAVVCAHQGIIISHFSKGHFQRNIYISWSLHRTSLLTGWKGCRNWIEEKWKWLVSTVEEICLILFQCIN